MGHSKSKTCNSCGEAAKVFVNFVKHGHLTTTAWCEHHATEAGVTDAQGYALLEAQDGLSHRRSDSSLRCPVCDCSQRDFERQGRFGCPACYAAFAGVLPQLLGRMHRDVDHKGKIPQRGADPASVRHRLALLQAELKDAVHTEHFEGAAQTRDAIAVLKAKLLAADCPPPGTEAALPPLKPPAK